MKQPQKIGHRGAKGYLAENTLESIQLALQFGVDAIEIDVHKCKSGELVVFHDFTLERITDGQGEIASKSWEELKRLYVYEKFRIPLLTEVLDLIKGKCWINIELKGLNTAAKTVRIIQHYIKNQNWNQEDFLVSSFQKDELLEVFKKDPDIQIGVLTETSFKEAIQLGAMLNAKAIHPPLGIITQENVKQAHKAGFKIFVWTVNEPADILRMKDFGVDGIISDFPDLLG